MCDVLLLYTVGIDKSQCAYYLQLLYKAYCAAPGTQINVTNLLKHKCVKKKCCRGCQPFHPGCLEMNIYVGLTYLYNFFLQVTRNALPPRKVLARVLNTGRVSLSLACDITL